MPKLTQPDSEELLAVTQGDYVAVDDRPTTIEALWQEMLEWDDRTSPEEYPEMAMLTFEEFSDFLTRHARSARIEGREEAAKDYLPVSIIMPVIESARVALDHLAKTLTVVSPSPVRTGDDVKGQTPVGDKRPWSCCGAIGEHDKRCGHYLEDYR